MPNAETAPLPIIDNRYRVTRVLGEGGMGIVYEAQHVGTKRPFAVKLIHASIARRGQAMERFLREGEAAGTIRSPHVVDVNDVGIDRATGSAFMAMELLSGDEIGKLIEERGRLSPQLALRIVAQALEGLAAAHRAGVVHRDIKPSNLWLARKPDNPLASGAHWVEGQRVVKVLDFGIAKLRDGDDGPEAKRNLTRTGGLVGSPSYMSPEQSGGLPDIDHRTDIWSLGAVMYEALTGTTPYQGAANLNQLMLQIALGPPELITRRDPNVPPDVAAIVTKALAHDPAGRYQSAEEMLSDVRGAIVGPEPITEEMLPVSIAAMVAAGNMPVGVAPHECLGRWWRGGRLRGRARGAERAGGGGAKGGYPGVARGRAPRNCRRAAGARGHTGGPRADHRARPDSTSRRARGGHHRRDGAGGALHRESVSQAWAGCAGRGHHPDGGGRWSRRAAECRWKRRRGAWLIRAAERAGGRQCGDDRVGQRRCGGGRRRSFGCGGARWWPGAAPCQGACGFARGPRRQVQVQLRPKEESVR